MSTRSVLFLATWLAFGGRVVASPTEPEFDPAGFKSSHLRVIALERGPEGERVWLGRAGQAGRMAVSIGQIFADGHLLEIDWEKASVRIHVDKEDPNRRLLQPWRIEGRRTFSTLDGIPFGHEGCPRFLARVEERTAWVRSGGPGEEEALGIGDEVCGGWRIESMEAGGDGRPGRDGRSGRLTLRKGATRLRLGASPP